MVSRIDSLCYLFKVPALVGKLSKWLIILSKFEIVYANYKTFKGQVVVEFLSRNSIEQSKEIEMKFPVEELAVIGIHK